MVPLLSVDAVLCGSEERLACRIRISGSTRRLGIAASGVDEREQREQESDPTHVQSPSWLVDRDHHMVVRRCAGCDCAIPRKLRQKQRAESWIDACADELGPPDHTTLRRYSVGVLPADLRNVAVNELVSLKPISRAISVTDWFGLAKRIFARSMRRLV